MMPLRVVSAFTNIAAPYFFFVPKVALRPRSIGWAVAQGEDILPAYEYMAYGFGLLFFTYYLSAQVRGGDTTAFTLSLWYYFLAFCGAFSFAGALTLMRVRLRFADAAAIYIYSFSTFSIFALVSNEIVDLILAIPALGHPVTPCPNRSLDCLVGSAGAAAAANGWFTAIEGLFGLVGMIYVTIMLRGAAAVRWWKIALAFAAVFAVNALINQFISHRVIDSLKSLGWWR